MDQLHNKVIRENKHGYVSVGINDHYRLYNKTAENPIKNPDLYKRILRSIFVKIWHHMFKDRWIFKAPCNFGYFYVAETFDPKGFYTDWKKSAEKGKIVRTYNFHTSGRQFYIKWDKVTSRVTNNTFYKFVPFRGDVDELSGKRGLAAWIKKCSKDPYLNDFRGHLI